MSAIRQAGLACSTLLGLLVLSSVAFGQAQSPSRSNRDGTPLIQLLDTVARKSSKTFVVDPAVQGSILMIGIDPENVTYSQLLAALQVHGFAAVEVGGITRIVPDARARAMASPILSGNERRDASEIVTHVFKVKSVSAAQLVPILRPLLPRSAHLAANQCTNEIVMVDSYANVKRIESVVAAMDKGTPLTLEPCSNRGTTIQMQPSQPAQPARPAEDR